ncbi:MAG: bifunctional methylenetetrahydrofolate dehydrogenase/methenyltetrahydrofolate cyclohydrolase FolD [Caldilineae bacterium]|nr:bifunctional methylenetetrahydrofolate dehydrogenase/methenyltetrahydrofolate cyclohydrolase FolD [Chloroflexota bacterium]MCB9175567.1 bifunctional methylenetetrahydrofolate dehydrogenase/methenyltetrahydrofolate cyclohydrolase FolD [Caldilineae bacterium]
MSAEIIDGRAVARKVRESASARVSALVAAGHAAPGLATVLVGQDPASDTYVRMKRRSCEELGIRSIHHALPADTSEEELLALVAALDADPSVDGILVQLPLPRQIDEKAVLGAIGIRKDVDGFHPHNLGLLAMKGREPLFRPCTPAGVMVLLRESGVTLSGAEAVVIGRSNIVGMPMAMLLIEADATVTVCHSRTRDLAAHLRRADIVVSAIGRPATVTGAMLKPGATVIDVGTNRVDAPGTQSGSRLVGDVDFDSAVAVAGRITPVPGGVGPMTIAMLMDNTVRSAEMRAGVVAIPAL